MLRKIAHAGQGEDAAELPAVIDGFADDGWVAAFGKARSELESVWTPDALLDATIALAWATLPGRAVLDAHAHELTVHAWDLAQATGRLVQLDPDLGARALGWFGDNVPPESRDEQGGFQDAVPAADVYTRLAAFNGRNP